MPIATRRWLVLVLTVGALLRFVPIWFGLPYPLARPDEEVAIGKALDALKGNLNPHFFHWPSLTFYVFAVVIGAATGLRDLFGAETPMTFAQHAILTRAVVALTGTFTILVLFHLARRVAGDAVGLLAAAFLAVAILHVRESHFAMTDVLMTLLLWTSLALLMRAITTQVSEWTQDAVRTHDAVWLPPSGGSRLSLYAAAGLAAGLATSTKYNAGAVAVAMVAMQALWFARQPWLILSWRAWRPTALFAATMAAGFIVATPYALLDYPKFLEDLRYDFTHLSGGHNGILLGRGYEYHATHSLPYGLGLPAAAAAVAGIVPFCRRYREAALVLGAFGAAFYAALGSGYTVFFRYVLPLIPLLCLLAAVGVDAVSSWLGRRFELSRARTLALVAAVTIGPGLVYSVWFDLLLARTDTRVIAGEWLTPHLEPGDTLYDSGGQYTRLDLWRSEVKRVAYDAGADAFAGGELPEWLVLHDSALGFYASTPAGVAAVARTRYSRAFEVRGTRGRTRGKVYDLQDAFFLPISGFSSVWRPGPSITIYRRSDR